MARWTGESGTTAEQQDGWQQEQPGCGEAAVSAHGTRQLGVEGIVFVASSGSGHRDWRERSRLKLAGQQADMYPQAALTT